LGEGAQLSLVTVVSTSGAFSPLPLGEVG